MKRELRDIEDVQQLIDVFCERALHDDLSGLAFHQIPDLHSHWKALYAYWSDAFLTTQLNTTEPALKHEELKLGHQHFIRWLTLFTETLDSLFEGTAAANAKITLIKRSEELQSRLGLLGF
ncbi:MAG: hypothetical protein ABJA70_14875 [Chryseolinea sp.]